jgi:enhancing lycopene biosynthesis protein 2
VHPSGAGFTCLIPDISGRNAAEHLTGEQKAAKHKM